MIDILKTKRLKQAISNNPAKVLETIENEMELGICITNSKGRYVAVNKRYCEIYGYTSDELVGNSFTIVVPEANHEKLQIIHDNFIKNEFEIMRNWDVKRRDGSVIRIQADAGFFKNIFDQTAHKVTFVHYEEAG